MEKKLEDKAWKDMKRIFNKFDCKILDKERKEFNVFGNPSKGKIALCTYRNQDLSIQYFDNIPELIDEYDNFIDKNKSINENIKELINILEGEYSVIIWNMKKDKEILPQLNKPIKNSTFSLNDTIKSEKKFKHKSIKKKIKL